MNLVTVIVPIYNAEKFLDRCIKSILNQSYKNIEVLLINDGSTDRSLEICKKYSNTDNRIKVISIQNVGQGLARNVGIKEATGRYITFIDSDDYMDKDTIELLMREMTDDVDAVIGGYKKVVDDDIIYKEKYKKNVYLDPYENLVYKMIGALPGVKDQVKGTVWNTLYDRNLIINNKIFFKSERKYFSEDTIFNIDYLRKAKKAVTIDSIGYNYVLNLQSTTTKYDEKKLENVSEYYKYILNILGTSDEVILRNQSFFLFNLKKCLQQVKYNPKNIKIRYAYKEIKNIITNRLVENILARYPLNSLDLKTRLILIAAKYKLTLVLTILVYYSIGRNKNYRKKREEI